MKYLFAISLACLVSACSTAQPLAQTPSYTIHNPEIFGSQPPLVDDDGIPFAVVATKDPFPWASGTARVAD